MLNLRIWRNKLGNNCETLEKKRRILSASYRDTEAAVRTNRVRKKKTMRRNVYRVYISILNSGCPCVSFTVVNAR